MILKKPKFWDFKKQNFFVYLLYPFTIFVEINNQDQLINYINKYFNSKNDSKKIVKDLYSIGIDILNKTYKEINK